MSVHAGSMLVEYYDRFLLDRQVENFRRDVESRYTEGTLCRVLKSTDLRARRGAVLALGLSASFAVNGQVAKALRDPDPTVRALAANSLWAIWSRADTPENNASLIEIQMVLGDGDAEAAIKKAERLIAVAPKFAEAYNQRAIAYYVTGRLSDSAADCKRVLELNPYHFGALSGLGDCQLRMQQRKEAIRTFRRALALQPYSEGLRERVAELEAAGD